MPTSFPEIFHELSEPFPADKVKIKPPRGEHYITARTVMNRLDKILGPENWWDEYIPSSNGVMCRLTIQLPDARTVTKADVGGHAGMSDEGDDEKSAFSDAFKRAAVKFGIGRDLYKDGIPAFLPEAPAKPEPADYKPPVMPANKKQVIAWLREKDPNFKNRTHDDNGIMERFKFYGFENGYPDSMADWSDQQAMAAYYWLSTKLEQEGKVNA